MCIYIIVQCVDKLNNTETLSIDPVILSVLTSKGRAMYNVKAITLNHC